MLTAEAACAERSHELERFVEYGLIRTAETALRLADERCRAAHAAVLEAQRALERARSQPTDLLAVAAAGSEVTDTRIDEAYAAKLIHRRRLAFREKTATAADFAAKVARNNLEEARSSAFLPALKAAAVARVRAAAQSEAAQGTISRAPDRVALAAAQESWDRAGRLLDFVRKGCSLLATVACDKSPPPNAEFERQAWENHFPGITREAA